jgi:hypothetical protein
MDLQFSLEERRFQQEVRSFLAERLPLRLSNKVRQSHRPNIAAGDGAPTSILKNHRFR